MAQRMWAIMAERNAQRSQAFRDDFPEAIRFWRSIGCMQGQKDLSMRGLRSYLREIPPDGKTYRLKQGVFPCAPCLAMCHRDGFILPVKILQPDTRDFTSPEAVTGEKQEDGTITNIDRLIAFHRCQQFEHILPRWAAGQ